MSDGDKMSNAFYYGDSQMVYGSGGCKPKDWLTGCSDGFKPFTSLSIAGHELSHGVTEYTSGLEYAVRVYVGRRGRGWVSLGWMPMGWG